MAEEGILIRDRMENREWNKYRDIQPTGLHAQLQISTRLLSASISLPGRRSQCEPQRDADERCHIYFFFGPTLLSDYFKRVFSFSSFCLSAPRVTELTQARLKRQIMARSRAPGIQVAPPQITLGDRLTKCFIIICKENSSTRRLHSGPPQDWCSPHTVVPQSQLSLVYQPPAASGETSSFVSTHSANWHLLRNGRIMFNNNISEHWKPSCYERNICFYIIYKW